MKNIFTGAIILILLLLVPIKATAQLRCYTLQAPEKTIEGMRSLAILNFENRKDINWDYYSSVNNYGAQLVDYMTAKLLEEHRGVYEQGENYMSRYKTNVYTVVDRNEISKTMQNQDFNSPRAISNEQAVQIGKTLKIDVVISGGYITNTQTSSNIKSHKEKKTGRIYYTYEATKTIELEVNMKIISIETGEVLAVTTKNKNADSYASSSKNKRDAFNKLQPNSTMIHNLMKDISFDLVSYFTPIFVYQNLDIEKPKVKSEKSKYEQVKTDIRAEDLSEAYAIVKSINKSDPYDAAMAHNMGILYEAVGDFDQAIPYHENALQIDSSHRHKRSLTRAKNSLAALEDLVKLGVKIVPYKFNTPTKTKKNYPKATTIGKKKDRINVYTSANKNSGVVMKVPGDTDFTILNRQENFVQIQLLEGKSGWISASNLESK